MRAWSTIAACLAILGLSACGGGDPSPAQQREASDREQIEAVAERFAAAVASEDTKAFCATLAPADVERLGAGRSDGKKRCLAVWGKGQNPLFAAEDADLSIAEIAKVNSLSATASLSSGGHLAFLQEGGTWYVNLSPATK